MNEPIDSSLPVGKYFEQVNDFIQYADAEKTLYTDAKVLHKAHLSVFTLGLYIIA